MAKKPDLGDKALRKILSATVLTTGDVIQEQQIYEQKELLTTARRHAIGLLSSIERQLMCYNPKCKKCYEEYGFITKCICDEQTVKNFYRD